MTTLDCRYGIPESTQRRHRLWDPLLIVLVLLLLPITSLAEEPGRAAMKIDIERLPVNPIIGPDSSPSIGTNINGPSVIEVPEWVTNRLGRYYLYFSHHKGRSIRLAYADDIRGPWRVYEPGALALENSGFPTSVDEITVSPEFVKRVTAMGRSPEEFVYAHVASPEAVVVPSEKQVRLYYHGMLENGTQATRVAVSSDGLHFTARPEVLARPYLRVFSWQGKYYGMAMPGVFYRSDDGLSGFTEGPTLFDENMRHAAFLRRGSTLFVFWTRVGDKPEQILVSTIDIEGDWMSWRASAPVSVLAPEREWEGARITAEPSVRGAIEVPANQLRDPEIFEEGGNTWLFYSVAGESGIAVARIALH